MTTLIALEGVDNAGKSTLLGEVRAGLARIGIESVSLVNRSPDDSDLLAIQHQIERLKADRTYDARAHAVLALRYYVAALRTLRQRNTRAVVTLIDRYIHSLFVYSSLNGVDDEWLCRLCTELPTPDLVVFLDVDPSTSVKRGDAPPLAEVRAARDKFRELLLERRWRVDDVLLPPPDLMPSEQAAVIVNRLLGYTR